MTSKHTIIILFNLGGPSSVEEIEPFLLSFLADPYVIRLPWYLAPLKKWFAKLIVKRRLPKSKKLYNEIGGKSPLVAITRKQAELLEKSLNHKVSVYPLMRHSKPNIEDLQEQLYDQIPDRIIAIPLYPQYSTCTTESSLVQIMETFPSSELISIKEYCDHPLFIEAWRQKIQYQLSEASSPDQIELVFCAHSIPVNYINQYQDPYHDHVQRTYQALAKLFPYNKSSLVFQSKAGPGRWLTPLADEYISQLALGSRIMLIPISFVSEHVETLNELDIEFKHIAQVRDIEFYRALTPQFSPLFIDCLRDIALPLLINI